ncbi:S-adenosyl methyltransferase [Haloechinothrix alba]|uniref:S-adenosyl methyltransferase n=1 Tax=Haloechinothrix alba TaxID=664784 RepID=A0A238VCA8_9PSEU|nr:SAM-dependent methyltransferase [Haloechinothrix alba]SNR31794.1 S-adenosyl methyltransferase [Haloechinothrix alba]
MENTHQVAQAPGSYTAISHLTTDSPSEEEHATMQNIYSRATAPMAHRNPAENTGLVGGFALVPPGLVRPAEWHPDDTHERSVERMYAGVGRKR